MGLIVNEHGSGHTTGMLDPSSGLVASYRTVEMHSGVEPVRLIIEGLSSDIRNSPWWASGGRMTACCVRCWKGWRRTSDAGCLPANPTQSTTLS